MTAAELIKDLRAKGYQLFLTTEGVIITPKPGPELQAEINRRMEALHGEMHREHVSQFMIRVALRAKDLSDKVPARTAEINDGCGRLCRLIDAKDDARFWPEMMNFCYLLDTIDAEAESKTAGAH